LWRVAGGCPFTNSLQLLFSPHAAFAVSIIGRFILLNDLIAIAERLGVFGYRRSRVRRPCNYPFVPGIKPETQKFEGALGMRSLAKRSLKGALLFARYASLSSFLLRLDSLLLSQRSFLLFDSFSRSSFFSFGFSNPFLLRRRRWRRLGSGLNLLRNTGDITRQR
jgi:hypothetical protein